MHRCIKCGLEFKGDSEDIIINGCPECGSKFFAYTKKGRVKKIKETNGESIESIMIKDHGVYEVNLSSLLENESLIISDEEGRYVIDLKSLMNKKLK
ncbi:MAG: hypothetical protein LLF83_04980 [Methanobacterium sp.]|nr:hypothetical protein [Methanobacterium sp.]